jgi:hypothetical protein
VESPLPFHIDEKADPPASQQAGIRQVAEGRIEISVRVNETRFGPGESGKLTVGALA